jgi:hypothetical protein
MPSNLKIEYLAPSALTPNPQNVRSHTRRQIAKLARIIKKLGWSTPIVVDESGLILAGHARLEAALLLGLTVAPCVRLTHLSPAEKLALAIADNKLSDESSFDDAALRAILIGLTDIDFDVELTGFDTGEIDVLIDGVGAASSDPADNFAAPDPTQPATSVAGDLWLLGKHKLFCGSALEAASFQQVLGADPADMIFTDAPFNVPVAGHVSGLGRHVHREFAMASGEMTDAEYRSFLATAMKHMADYSRDGSIHFHCSDWRHVRTMLEAAAGLYAEVKNICVWVKTNAGMGTLYRSQHELVVVLKKGAAPHQNNVQLGKHGRWRSNVWQYPGANAFGPTRNADLAAHPTVKPVALIADAIRDVSKRGDIVLDPFIGSGTTILAAERTGRRGVGIEIDPLYVDTALRRWESITGKAATLASNGQTFDEVQKARLTTAEDPSPPASGGADHGR